MIATLFIIFQFLRSIPWTTAVPSPATTNNNNNLNSSQQQSTTTSETRTTDSPLTSNSLSCERKSDETSSENKHLKDKHNFGVRNRKVSIETSELPKYRHQTKLINTKTSSTINPLKNTQTPVDDEEEEEEGDVEEDDMYNSSGRRRRSDSSEGDYRDTEEFYQNIQEGTSYQYNSNPLMRLKRSSVGQSSVFMRSDSSATNTSSSGSGGTFTAGKRRSTASSIASDIIPTDRRSSTENSRSSGHRRSSGKIRRNISRVTIAGARRRTTGR